MQKPWQWAVNIQATTLAALQINSLQYVYSKSKTHRDFAANVSKISLMLTEPA